MVLKAELAKSVHYKNTMSERGRAAQAPTPASQPPQPQLVRLLLARGSTLHHAPQGSRGMPQQLESLLQRSTAPRSGRCNLQLQLHPARCPLRRLKGGGGAEAPGAGEGGGAGVCQGAEVDLRRPSAAPVTAQQAGCMEAGRGAPSSPTPQPLRLLPKRSNLKRAPRLLPREKAKAAQGAPCPGPPTQDLDSTKAANKALAREVAELQAERAHLQQQCDSRSSHAMTLIGENKRLLEQVGARCACVCWCGGCGGALLRGMSTGG